MWLKIAPVLSLIASFVVYYYLLQTLCSDSQLSLKFKDDSPLAAMAASSSKHSAFILGGTGSVGKEIVKALAASTGYEKVTLIGRRQVELPPSDATFDYSKFDQKLMDFDRIPEQSGFFAGYDVGFYAIGVSTAKVSADEYKKVELENALAIVNAIKEGGGESLKHLHWVSGQGSSKKSLFLFGRVKAQLEETLEQMGFPRVSIYRPAGVLSQDNSGMMGPKTQAVVKAIDIGHCLTIDSELMGKAIAANTFREAEKPYEILENKDILKLGKAVEK